MRADQIHQKKSLLKSFCFLCFSLVEHFATNQRAPTNRHWVSAVTTTISPCCKASIWGSSSSRAHQTSQVNRPTAEVPTLPDPVKYKISIGRSHKFPNMGSNRLPQLSDPPFIGQHMLLPPTSARPISQHCLAERPALHSVRRARPMQPCPATASRGRSWRQPAPSTGSSCSARCSPPNQRYNWIANKLTSPSPKYTHQRVRVEEPAPTQTALFMDNYHCYTLLDAYLQTGIYGMHRNLREGRNTQNF